MSNNTYIPGTYLVHHTLLLVLSGKHMQSVAPLLAVLVHCTDGRDAGFACNQSRVVVLPAWLGTGTVCTGSNNLLVEVIY